MGRFTLVSAEKKTDVQFIEGETFFSALSRNYDFQSPCGGNGRCGKCRIELTYPDGSKENALACRIIATPAEVVCTFTESRAQDSFTAAVTSERTNLCAAVDIGTTTVELNLIDVDNGKAAGTLTELNSQGKFGADILSRIKFAVESDKNRREIQSAIVNQISSMLKKLSSGVKINSLTAVGNPAMVCFLSGIDSRSLGFAPFTLTHRDPITADSLSIGFPEKFDIYIPGSTAAYIGSDITAGLMISGASDNNITSLYLDLGTNGEMVLCHKGKLTCCSVAAGPAFEGASIEFGTGAVIGAVSEIHSDLTVETISGGKPCGICGSGIIDAAAVLLENGIMDETGCINPELSSTYNNQPALELCKGKIFFTQKDVRELQLAKAAIQAGIRVLAENAGIEIKDIDRLYLAGSFGCHINLASCGKIGLLSGIPEEKTILLGNAAGAGSIELAKSPSLRQKTEEIRKRLEYIELFKSESFQSFFTNGMMFGEEL